MPSVEFKIKKILKDVEEIQSLIHPIDHHDPKLNLFRALSRRDDAVRMTVLQTCLAIEDLLDGLFWRFFAAYNPGSRKRVRRTAMKSRQLDELLKSGRMGFEAKLRLARLTGIVTKSQHNKLDTLRALRNKCSHHWTLNRVRTRRKGNRPTKRLLEFEGHDLFDLKILQDFMKTYSRIYLALYGKYLADGKVYS
jgi:hypothetical protein